MSANSDSIVEIKVGYPEFVPKSCTSNLKMTCISVCQRGFIFLLSKKINGVYRTVLFHKLEEMSFKRRLGSMGSSNLDTLAKSLQTLLFPENCKNPIKLIEVRQLQSLTRNTSTYLYVTDTMLVRTKYRFCLETRIRIDRRENCR